MADKYCDYFDNNCDYYSILSCDYTHVDPLEEDYHFDIYGYGYVEYMDPNESIELVHMLGYLYAKENVWNVIGEIFEDDSYICISDDDIVERICSGLNVNMIQVCALNLYPFSFEQIEIVGAAPHTLGADCCIHAFEDGIRSFINEECNIYDSQEWTYRYYELEKGLYENECKKDYNIDKGNNYPIFMEDSNDFFDSVVHDNIVTNVSYHTASSVDEEFLSKKARTFINNIDTKIKSDEVFKYISVNYKECDNKESKDIEIDSWLDEMINKHNRTMEHLASMFLIEDEDVKKSWSPSINKENIINSEDSCVIFFDDFASEEMDGNAFSIEGKPFIIEKTYEYVQVRGIKISSNGLFEKYKSFYIRSNSMSDLYHYFDYEKIYNITKLEFDENGHCRITFEDEKESFVFDYKGNAIEYSEL